MQIIIKNQQRIIPVSKRAVKTTVLKTLKILKVNLSGELTVVYVNNRAIQELNHKFLGRRQPTDVLCFDLSRGRHLIADIIISTEQAKENARLFKTSASWEARLYLIHAILHLRGFKDKRINDRIRMQRKALKIMEGI
ncbi:MAG: rRNA maturation RNase YbeY [Candidatus Omnitrophota bacterium]